MSLTKEQVVTAAYKWIGESSPSTSMISEGVPLLERMMWTWWNEFIDTGYTFATTVSDALPADDSTLTPVNEDGVILNLAVKLATLNAIVAGGTLMQDAKNAKNGMYQLTPQSMAQNPYMPLGAGATRHCSYVKYQGEGNQEQTLTYGGSPLVTP